MTRRDGGRVTIEDFLLARTAETESRASALHLDGCAVHANEPDRCDCLQPLRQLRICAATRQVIELHQAGRPVAASDDEGARHPAFVPCVGHETSWVEYPCALLRVMATVFADHHDFRAEWTMR